MEWHSSCHIEPPCLTNAFMLCDLKDLHILIATTPSEDLIIKVYFQTRNSYLAIKISCFLDYMLIINRQVHKRAIQDGLASCWRAVKTPFDPAGLTGICSQYELERSVQMCRGSINFDASYLQMTFRIAFQGRAGAGEARASGSLAELWAFGSLSLLQG